MNVTEEKCFASRSNPATIHEAAAALEDGSISSRELCSRLLQRNQEVDGVIQAYLHLHHTPILEEAEKSDLRRAASKPLSRFDGIPVAIKDNISVRGQTCGCASKILEGYTAPFSATVIDKLNAAGIISFGRTNMDEFAMGSSTEHSGYQKTRNPWNVDHVPGGSSGGSAAAVSSGQALAALGSDTGGSIRQPAGFCGVVGLKPSYGRVSRYGLVAFASSLDQIGPITRDVRDSAILLDLISGHDPLDSTSIPEKESETESRLHDLDISKLKIGIPEEFLNIDGLSSEDRNIFDENVSRFEDAGSKITRISLPHLRYSISSYYMIATAEASSNLARFDGIRYGNRAKNGSDLIDTYFKTREAGFGEEVKRRILLGTYVLSSGYYDAYYLRAQKMRTLIRKDFDDAFEQCDVILSPVSPSTAFPVGSVNDPLQMYLSDIYTITINLAGICAVSVPAGVDSKKLPVGIQFIAGAMQEEILLQSASWFTAHHDKEPSHGL